MKIMRSFPYYSGIRATHPKHFLAVNNNILNGDYFLSFYHRYRHCRFYGDLKAGPKIVAS